MAKVYSLGALRAYQLECVDTWFAIARGNKTTRGSGKRYHSTRVISRT